MSEILESWHFTKENVYQGIPPCFRSEEDIRFYLSSSQEKFYGEYRREGRWIRFEENAMLHFLSDGRIYHISDVPPPLSRFEQWKRSVREWIRNLF